MSARSPSCTKANFEVRSMVTNRYSLYAEILCKHFGDRITVWAPFNLPGTFAYLGYGAGAFPPGKADSRLFLRAAHTISLAQPQALQALKAASSKATVGSAYGMAPAYPKTNSEADRAATARYHAMNNVFFLHAAMYGEYSKALVGETPFKEIGFRPGDETIMKAPLDWVRLSLLHPPHRFSRKVRRCCWRGAVRGRDRAGRRRHREPR